jgi:hypothetical protein
MKMITNIIAISLIIFLIIIVIYILVNNTSFQKKKEYYSIQTTPKTFDKLSKSVEEFIRDNGFDTIENLENFIQGNYNEEVANIIEDNTLTLYYSAFSKNSLPKEQDRVWTNISPFFKDTKVVSCKYLSFENTHMISNDSLYANRAIGIQLLSNSLTGPASHLLGVQGNGTFSIFVVLTFNSIFSSTDEQLDIFKLFGNTLNNNGLTLSIEKGRVQNELKNKDEISFKVTYGGFDVLHSNVKDKKTFKVDLTQPYLIVLTKNHKSINLNLHNLSTEFSHKSTISVIDNEELKEPNVLFSNKELIINENKNINGNIYAFGVYNMFLMDESHLHNYMYHQIFKSSEIFMKEARQVLKFQNELEQMKACPYNASVCKDCIEVSDWTDMNQLISSKGKCKDAIHNYCTENVNDPKCICWKNDSSECVSFRNIFERKRLIDPLDMTNETIDDIKKNNKLCDCSLVEKLEKELSTLEEKLKEKNNSHNNVNDQPRSNKLPPTHKLTSPYALGGPIETTGASCPYKEALLENTPSGVLPPVNNASLNNIANLPYTYKGEEGDESYFNNRVANSYEDTRNTQQNSNTIDNIDTKMDFQFDKAKIEPAKGFWSWLLNF